MQRTSIQWTDYSWSPIKWRHKETGKSFHFCTHVSEGCKNCFSETLNKSFGTGLDYTAPNERLVEPWISEKEMKQPRRLCVEGDKVFVMDMSDLFHYMITDGMILDVMKVIKDNPHITFQVLTKRPQRMWRFMSYYFPEPLPNLWLGVSVENQQAAETRLNWCLDTWSAVRWVSVEPLLERVDLRPWLSSGGDTYLDWVVVGGESGPKARPFYLSWARDIISQCRDTDTAVFIKQMGSNAWDSDENGEWRMTYKDKKGGDWNEWGCDLQKREMPR